MLENNIGFIKIAGVKCAPLIDKYLPKKTSGKHSYLQPIFEAFTNAIESIKEIGNKEGEIVINFFFNKGLINDNEFQKAEVQDNGIGFNDINFERFTNLYDNTKSNKNKGTGRIQFIHFFNKVKIKSIFKVDNIYKNRELVLSKEFLPNNAIIKLDKDEEARDNKCSTVVTFLEPLDEKDKIIYNDLTAEKIKIYFTEHYLIWFCENRENMPQIKINCFVNNILEQTETIQTDDIYESDKILNLEVSRSKIDNGKILKTENKETFRLTSFLIPKEKLEKNELILVSKGERTDNELHLEFPKQTDSIEGNKYLFLLSSDYIDNRDDNIRGNIKILSMKEFKKKLKQPELFSDEEVLIEDIESETNRTISENYDYIKTMYEEKEKNIRELQEMFLLNKEAIEKIIDSKSGISESDEEILKKVYEYDSEVSAKKDAEIKNVVTELNSLIPNKENNYQNELIEKVNKLVKQIPIQNRTELTKYVARRKIVLNLFEKILNNELESLKANGRIDEKIMHNLLFQQSSNSPENSDLWLINEDFIYFKGVSEKELKETECEYNGNKIKIFNKKFSEEEEKYLNSLGEKRLAKRPDILLFPDEGKCIIIELKAPEVNVSDYLTQIDKYASLIRNYTVDKIKLTTFYGYLIGEGIEYRDVIAKDSSFEYSYHFDYLFRPSKRVFDFEEKTHGSIYIEVIKYSTLLKRAKLRNRVFIEKLEKRGNVK